MTESLRSVAVGRSTRTYFLTASDQASQLAGQLAEEMARRWQSGERPLADELLAPHPELLQQPDAAIKVICEEVCLRQDYGLVLDAAELQRRFPQFHAQIQVLFDCHRLLQAGTAPVFPAVGERLLDFQLVKLLGKGALGRVYLARQSDLADRLVVLKASPLGNEEHLSLARLQHTHIVPLYHVFPDSQHNLLVLCMPYLGGTSLDRLLGGHRERPLNQRRGNDLLQGIDQAESTGLLPRLGTVRAFLTRSSYVEAVCWIGACLAEALQYAHERGLVHLDLKPSNVLLAADGQPMLLDFHLALKPLQAGDPAPIWFGGTAGYMSPEQRQVLQAMKVGQKVPEAVGPPSDIYSLGALLYECLAGRLPSDSPRPLQRENPEISAGLADVLARCLRHDPRQRYPDAGGLAIDLRRHLANLPLQAVPNRSLVERWRKWRRRRPHALTVGLLVCLVMAVAAGAGYLFWERQQQRVRQAEQALEDGRDLRHQGRHADASRALARGLDVVRDQAGQHELASRLQAELQVTRKAQLRHDLHALTEQILFTFDSETRSPEDLRKLSDTCRKLWQARAELGDATGAEGDHLDLAILWADLLVRSAVEPGSACQEALALLQETEKEFGPNVVLYRERQRYAQALGRTDLAIESAARAARLSPRTAWEHYALGRALLRGGDLADAAHHLDLAVALQPHGFWPNFYQGVCAHRRGKHDDAIAAFRACITLAPEKAECYFNRALAYQALDNLTAALGDYDRAVHLNPALAAAWLNRGILHLGQNRLEQAARDLDQALGHGSDPSLVHYNLALVCQAQARFDQALTHVRQALRLRPTFAPARELEQRLLTK